MKSFDPLIKKQILHNVGKFFDDPGDSHVYKIKIPTDVLYGLLDYDFVKTFSNHIDVAQQQDLHNIDLNLQQYNTDGWPSQLNCIRILYKTLWLLKDIEEQNKIHTPFQFIKTKYGYMVHPGTTKLFVSAYLNPIDYHEGFYVHSPQIDNEGIILDYKTTEVKTTNEFISMFDFDRFYFKFRTLNLTTRTKLSSHSYIPEIFYNHYQSIKNLQYKIITYYDNHNPNDDTNWANKRFDIKLNEVIKFTDSNTCLFNDIKFKKINNTWIKS